MIDLSGLRTRLDADPSNDPEPGDRAAAVLALIIEDPEPALLFTERTASMSRHPGEVSFPGGLRDPGDLSLEDTALREVQEELGIEPSAIRILGALAPIHTFVSGILVTPFVGLTPTLPTLHPSRAEIARSFTISIRSLAANEERHVLHRGDGGEFLGWRYAGEGTVVWGATGFMLHALLELLREEAPWLLS